MWANGTVPTLSTAANAVDIVSCYCNGTNLFCQANTNFQIPSVGFSIDLERDNSQYLSASDSPSLSVTGDMTIELWVKLESLLPTSSDYNLVNKYVSSGYSYRFYLERAAGSDIYIYISIQHQMVPVVMMIM